MDYTIKEKVKLIAGGQYNNVGEGVSKFVLRLGMIVNFTPSFGFKALYAQTFRAPYIIEKKIAIPGYIIGKEDMKPEEVTTIDLQLFHQTEKHQLALTVYQSQQKDLVSRKGIGEESALYGDYILQFNNVDELKIQGIEFESKFTPTPELYFTGSFTYQENENGAGIKNYSLTPSYMIKTGVGYQTDAFSAGLFYNYASAFHSSTIQFGENVPMTNPDEDDFTNLSLNLSMNLKELSNKDNFPNMRLSLYGKNLLDDQIHVPHSDARINTRPSVAGRAFYLRLIYSY